MRSLQQKICLVIPCYNEEQRLNFKKFKNVTTDCHFLFVDDGSKDNTYNFILENINDNMQVIKLPKNAGKGEAVRQGMLYLKQLPLFAQLDWIGYWDADLATPLEELKNFFTYAQTFPQTVDAVFGSRIYKLGCCIKRSNIRHYLGRAFATVAHIMFKIESYDTQCGAKLIKKELLDICFSQPFVSKWIFDLEILFRLQNYHVIEYPIKNWAGVYGSKVKISKTMYKTLLDLYKIRKKYHPISP